ncbi:MAG: hypothetical protein WCI20_11780, partial [bacterium]
LIETIVPIRQILPFDLTVASAFSIVFAGRDIMAPNKSFGLKVAETRRLVTPKMSQAELARRLQDYGLKLTSAEVGDIEAGQRSLNYCQVTMLASVLNTTANQLLS